ncbi:MAG: tRNA uridine-5-carboxymethylaminomethyl(34) synthesis enzyme MnmG [Muribaculaceae bacterium]|nr:tRNA uridine-5-carboxymethylaminomethyl(34) synthesis enzyme MnmG [Muribaculaceae bacterium]
MNFNFDVIVIGAGHAGCEAAVAAANMGSRTILITKDMNRVAQMSCNPAVGGIAKGQIVREIDALGGQMGIVADETAIQFRMLNLSKGPAVWSPRVQSDRTKYIDKWRSILDATPNLSLFQDTVSELIFEESEESSCSPVLPSKEEKEEADPSCPPVLLSKKEEADPSCPPVLLSEKEEEGVLLSKKSVAGVRTALGFEFRAPRVILTAGTFLNGLMHFGRTQIPGGRIAEDASLGLTDQLKKIGFEVGRMKTGTPARIDGRTIDFSLATRQDGDDTPEYKFSFLPEVRRSLPQRPCWIVHTNPKVHEILRDNLADSPLYNGQIQSIGPRYCPSIETKIVTFADKESHQLFLEPEGETTQEYYINGFSSSLPWKVQVDALSKVPALRDVQFYRPGYAIEYDFFIPTQLTHDLQSKLVSGLYFAGQVNGTTGYEEAAAQGLMAGINAARAAKGESPLILKRDEAYIGVLIDDLVTKGVDEPYRMFTSRAEYRILLRQDDADMRLTPIGREIGLASQERFDAMESKRNQRDALIEFARRYLVKATPEINDLFETLNTAPLTASLRLIELIKRPQLNFEILSGVLPKLREEIRKIEERRRKEIVEAAEILIKYDGYITRERDLAQKQMRLEYVKIPSSFNYEEVPALSTEARQKLTRIRPSTIGQASRIPGVSPSDINVLLLLLGR